MLLQQSNHADWAGGNMLAFSYASDTSIVVPGGSTSMPGPQPMDSQHLILTMPILQVTRISKGMIFQMILELNPQTHPW